MTDAFDDFLVALEKFVDAQDDAWIEEENCNYRQALKIREEVAAPAKQAMREAFNKAVIEAIENNNIIRKEYHMGLTS